MAVKAESESFNPIDFLEKLIEFTRVDAYKEKLEKAKGLLNNDDKREIIRNLGNSVEALNSVPTAIYYFAKHHQSYAKAVLYAISLGGDTDTIGAMTGAIAGAYHGIEVIPSVWVQKLERRDYIERLADELWKLKMGNSSG